MTNTGDAERQIPSAIVTRCCDGIPTFSRLKPWTRNGLWCWVCTKQAKGDSDRMCFSSRVDNRGGSRVNRRYIEGVREPRAPDDWHLEVALGSGYTPTALCER